MFPPIRSTLLTSMKSPAMTQVCRKDVTWTPRTGYSFKEVLECAQVDGGPKSTETCSTVRRTTVQMERLANVSNIAKPCNLPSRDAVVLYYSSFYPYTSLRYNDRTFLQRRNLHVSVNLCSVFPEKNTKLALNSSFENLKLQLHKHHRKTWILYFVVRIKPSC